MRSPHAWQGLTARKRPPLLIGVIHLLPLPGAPRPSPGLDEVCARAAADARTLLAGGADAAIVENLGDAPFTGQAVDPATVAAMTRAALAVRAAAPTLPLGINVLRNDARAALGIAAAVGAQFIRVNVHSGVMVSDQGFLKGAARETLLERNRLGSPVGILADVHVKHARPLGGETLEDAARDAYHRGLADVLIVSGSGTGQRTDPADLASVRAAVPDAPVWIGSGVTPDHLGHIDADGLIVGTWLHSGGDLEQPLEVERVHRLREHLEASTRGASPP